MKQFTIFLTISLLLGACGAQPVPTTDPADVQLTAVAAAFTIVAETQASVPTSTPLPPTETASPTLPPTNTAVALPTLGTPTLGAATLAPTTAAGGAATPYYCDTRVLSWSPKGKATTIRIANLTKAPVTVSLYLIETQDHNECGYRSYNIAKNGDVVINDLVQGCYNLLAWSTDPQIPVRGYLGGSCIN
ncbi:MAG TPA: hypothetical protein VFM35_06945, partial [Candidatus Binatia bacterium]|nr:hypothetical protein [Candidatus Binatia bacterium]